MENTDTTTKVIGDGKRLVKLAKDYSRMEIIDKGSSIISSIILALVIISLATIAVFFLCMALYHSLNNKVNDPVLSYSILAIGILFLCVLVLLLKKTLISKPTIKMLNTKLFSQSELAEGNTVSSSKEVSLRKAAIIKDLSVTVSDLRDKTVTSLSPRQRTSKGVKYDFNKLVSYALITYKGVMWAKRLRSLFKKNKKR